MHSPPGWPNQVTLASASIARRQLLESLGVEVDVRPSSIVETAGKGETPGAHVLRLAAEKAMTAQGLPGVVIAADTIVDLDGKIFGKPANRETARQLLHYLSGRSHLVTTGIVLMRSDILISRLVTTEVKFRPCTDEMIEWYLATNDFLNRAGGYSIFGFGKILISGIKGSPTNALGLPIEALDELFAHASSV